MKKTLLILALLACAWNAADGRAAPSPSCAPLAGWSEIAQASAGKYLIFGETHGAREGPQAVAEFVCQVSTEPLLLAVEWFSRKNAELQKAWVSQDDFPAALRRAMTGALGSPLDGRSSQAMFDMLVRLHAIKDAGADIDVVAFAGPKDDEQARRFAQLPGRESDEAAQAENIRTAASTRHYGRVVILVGSAHAEKRPIKLGDTHLAPMALKLAPPQEIISLKMGFSEGSIWNCTLKSGVAQIASEVTRQNLDCSAHQQIRGDGPPRQQPSMGLSQQEPGFDGYYFLGAVSASPTVQ